MLRIKVRRRHHFLGEVDQIDSRDGHLAIIEPQTTYWITGPIQTLAIQNISNREPVLIRSGAKLSR